MNAEQKREFFRSAKEAALYWLKKRMVLSTGHMWPCEQSAIGVCVYDHHFDPPHDHCIFCGDPEERK